MYTFASSPSRARTVVAVVVAAVFLLPAGALAQTCVPPAVGVFGNATPPHWWDNVPPQAVYHEDLDDPRWVQAGVIALDEGTGTLADFRALHGDGQTNLYLSWRVFLAPAASANQNQIYFGLQRSAAAGGGNVVAKLTLPGTQLTGAALVPSIEFYELQPDGHCVPDIVNPNVCKVFANPAWLSQTARVWGNMNGPTKPQANLFAGEVQVPLNFVNVSGGTFNMWFELLGGTPATHDWIVTWPRGASGQFIPGSAFTGSPQFPTPAGAPWQSFRISSGPGDPSCANSGVSLDIYQIGTHNNPSSLVKYALVAPFPMNTFFARPRNGTLNPIPANTLVGRFRLANWGSYPGNESGVPANVLWSDIPGGSAVENVGAILPGAVADATNELRFNWTVSAADALLYENGTRARDNCLLVDLTSKTGITFTNNSIRRNMDFEKASKMERVADISVKGLTPIAPDGRDVYLYIETLNLPAKGTPPPPPPPPGIHPNVDVPATVAVNKPDNQQQLTPEQLHEAAASGSLTDAQMDTFVPTYRVHVFHDTGRTITTGTVTRPLLEPQAGFGYRVLHQGEILGWVHNTVCVDCTLEELAPNFYRIKKVPNNGTVHVRTTIEAVEPGTGGKWGWFLDAGPNFPHGDLSNVADGKYSVNFGIERLFSNVWSAEGILGYHAFDIPEIDARIWQLSVNGKRFFGTSPLRPFVNAGIGAYRFQPDDLTKFGWNVGGGVLYQLTPKWGIEGVYNYHSVNVDGSDATWSTAQVGIRGRF